MRFIIFSLVIAISSFSSIAKAQDTHVAIFKSVSGSVNILRNKASIPATVGQQLMNEDEIISSRGASSGMVFRDGTLITLGPSTELKISQYAFQPDKSIYKFAMYLKTGTAIYSSGKLGKLSPESVNLNTPRAIVGIRGTRFIVEVD
jgi:hypothetical protein